VWPTLGSRTAKDQIRSDQIFEALVKVQKRATKILPSLRHISYPDRLKVCKLTTLHYRQIRMDMIEAYKIVSGKYDSAITPTLTISDTHKTRGNDLRPEVSL